MGGSAAAWVAFPLDASGLWGCVGVASGVFGLVVGGRFWGKVTPIVLVLMQFGLAAFFSLPDRLRRTKIWLKVAVFLLGLTVMSLSVVGIVAASGGNPI